MKENKRKDHIQAVGMDANSKIIIKRGTEENGASISLRLGAKSFSNKKELKMAAL